MASGDVNYRYDEKPKKSKEGANAVLFDFGPIQ